MRRYGNRSGNVVVDGIVLVAYIAGVFGVFCVAGREAKLHNFKRTEAANEQVAPHGHEAVAKAESSEKELTLALATIAENLREIAPDISKPSHNFTLGPWQFEGVGSGVFVVAKTNGGDSFRLSLRDSCPSPKRSWPARRRERSSVRSR